METVIKQFIRLNKLKQRDLAQFLGISEPAVSNLVSGKNNPSEENLTKLLENEMGWDVSPLINNSTIGNNSPIVSGDGNFFTQNSSDELLRVKNEQIRQLEAQIEYLKDTTKQLIEIINKSNK